MGWDRALSWLLGSAGLCTAHAQRLRRCRTVQRVVSCCVTGAPAPAVVRHERDGVVAPRLPHVRHDCDGSGEPSPGADVGGASPVPAQMWEVEPSPSADVGGVSPAQAPMWQAPLSLSATRPYIPYEPPLVAASGMFSLKLWKFPAAVEWPRQIAFSVDADAPALFVLTKPAVCTPHARAVPSMGAHAPNERECARRSRRCCRPMRTPSRARGR